MMCLFRRGRREREWRGPRPSRGGCFACMLGGPDRRTLFMLTAEWAGTENVEEQFARRTGRVYVAEVEIPGAGWP
jgi:sugar lactone lactonase YvrE